MTQTIDTSYAIIGGGSAGCVLAARLSENPCVHVTLIEAGGTPNSERFRVPAGLSAILEKPKFDWCYQTDFDPTANNRRMTWSAGKVLGGGSSINGMVYVRGQASDYDRWDANNGGNSGWSYADMEAYFKKAECFTGRSESHLGNSGPLKVSPTKDRNPLADQFIKAGLDLGYSEVDLNSGNAIGFGEGEGTVFKGRRASTYECYLAPIKKRRNLNIITHAEAQKILIKDGKAIGVEIVADGIRSQILASKETLVCAGGIGSPALLMRSGIGDPEALAAAGVDTEHALNGVGKNLQEHIGCGIGKFVNVTTINSQMGPLAGLKHVIKYYTQKTGLLASPVVQSMAYVKTLPELEYPDVQLAFVPFGYTITEKSTSALTAETPKQDAVMISGFICNPKTRGTVSLDTSNIFKQPVIDFQFFRNEDDLHTLVRSCKLIEKLYEQPSLKPYVTGECTIKTPISSDQDWMAYIRDRANICYHFSGTCSMGVDDTAVVNPQLQVRGIESLRVVDASVIPSLTSGNTNAPVIAIAEKAADMIKHAN